MTIVDINPNLFTIGIFSIKWYSLAYLFGLLLGWYFTLKNIKKTDLKLTKTDIEDLFLTYALIGIILGGRLGYVLFYNFSYYLNHPSEIFAIWRGGMSFHGGMIGVITAIVLFAYIKKIPIRAIGDIVCLITPIGLFLGRIGNFINGELYGRVTTPNFPMAVIFKNVDNLPRHPSQLYEAFLEGVVLFIILNLLWQYSKKIREMTGFISGLFLLLYGLFRSFVEIFRTPDIQLGYLYNKITMGQVLCVPMIVLGLYFIITAIIFATKTKKVSD